MFKDFSVVSYRSSRYTNRILRVHGVTSSKEAVMLTLHDLLIFEYSCFSCYGTPGTSHYVHGMHVQSTNLPDLPSRRSHQGQGVDAKRTSKAAILGCGLLRGECGLDVLVLPSDNPLPSFLLVWVKGIITLTFEPLN